MMRKSILLFCIISLCFGGVRADIFGDLLDFVFGGFGGGSDPAPQNPSPPPPALDPGTGGGPFAVPVDYEYSASGGSEYEIPLPNEDILPGQTPLLKPVLVPSPSPLPVPSPPPPPLPVRPPSPVTIPPSSPELVPSPPDVSENLPGVETPQKYPPPASVAPENGKQENYPPPVATVLIPDRQQEGTSAPTTTTNDGMSTPTKIIIAVSCSVGGIILLAIVVVLCCCCGQKRRVKHSGGNDNDLERGRRNSTVPRTSSGRSKSQKGVYQVNSFDPYLREKGLPEVVPLGSANMQVSYQPANKSTLVTSDILKNGPGWISNEAQSEALSNIVGPMAAAAATASSWASLKSTKKKKPSQQYSEAVFQDRQVETNSIHNTNNITEDAMVQNDSKSSLVTAYDIEFSSMELDLPVGQGSFGTIYRAIWNETPVAVKFLTPAKDKESCEPDNTGKNGLLSILESEGEILSSLRHPNIVQFIGVCSQPPCIISEFVEKGSLSDLIRGTRDPQELSWGLLLKMLTDAATGMLYLHARSSPIIHCDLKSNNILVDSFYRTKICDFNLSRLLEQSTGSPLASVQNPRWIAPEVLDGEGYSKESDIYSFGVVMWEVLTRQIPWYGVDTGDIVSLVRDGARPQVPNFWDVQDGRGNEFIVFEEYVELMTSCWSQNLYDRPSFAEIIKAFKDMILLSGQHVVPGLGARNLPPEEREEALLTNESTRAMTDSMPHRHV